MTDYLSKVVDVISADMQILEKSLQDQVRDIDNQNQEQVEEVADLLDYLEINLNGTLSVIRSVRAKIAGFDEPVPTGSAIDLEASVLRDIANINKVPRPSRLGSTWR